MIERVETCCLKLHYPKAVQFASVKESAGHYLLLRIVTRDGAEGLAECVCRPAQSGETPAMLANVIREFYASLLTGADPFDHNRLLREIGRIKGQRTAFALVDVALWDLIKGKLLGQPVPLAWIVHSNFSSEQVKEAVEAVEKRGFAALKFKACKRSCADVEMVRAVRKPVGDERIVWIDCNGSYTETEALAVLPELAPYGISFIEEPCRFPDQARMTALAGRLAHRSAGRSDLRLARCGADHHPPGGQRQAAPHRHRRIAENYRAGRSAGSAGGHLHRFRIAYRRYAAPSPALRDPQLGAVADDAFVGTFTLCDGAVTRSDAFGFGVWIDMKKLRELTFV